MHSWRGPGTPEPFCHLLTSLSSPQARLSWPFPTSPFLDAGRPPPWDPGFLPPQGTEGQQGAPWSRVLGSAVQEKLGSDAGWRNAAEGLSRQIRPPHTPRNWQGTDRCGHSATGPGTSPAHPPRSSSAAPPLGEGGLVTANCPGPARFCNWVKD